jgi:hypothetical protein
MLPTKLRFIWLNGFRGEESKKSANQKQESPVAVMFDQMNRKLVGIIEGKSPVTIAYFVPIR